MQGALDGTASMPCERTAGVTHLPPGLAAFKGVTMQIISCFESFVRAAAAGLVGGSLVHCSGPTLQNPQLCRICVVIQGIGAVSAAEWQPGVADDGCSWDLYPLLALVHAAGPGSFEQRQMFSLLRSMLKFSNGLCDHSHKAIARKVCHTVAAAAAALLVPSSCTIVEVASTPMTAAAGQGSAQQTGLPGTEPSADHHAAGPGTTAAGVTDANSDLLQARAPLVARQSTGEPLLPAVLHAPSLALSGLCWHSLIKFEVEMSATSPFVMLVIPSMSTPVLDRLGVPLHAEQLCAAGQGALAHLRELDAIKIRIRRDGVPTFDAGQLMQHLRAAGSALASLPTHMMCNNPACSNVTGHSELQLVTGPSNQCGGCRTARYCCKACQWEHWAQHKPFCRARAAAMAESHCL